jgi:hypothetical protein
MSNFLIDEDTDLLAAEFVLGTLDSEERASAQSLLRTDHGFIAMVRIWERRFGELHLMVEPVEPDAKIFQRIKAKVAEIAPPEPVPEDKPPLASAPSPELPAAVGAPASAEMPKPADAATADATTADAGTAGAGTAGEAAPAQELPADVEPPKPAEPPATGEVPTPHAVPTPPAAPAAAEPAAASAPGGLEPGPPETAAKPESEPTAKVPPPVTPPPLVKPAEQPPDVKVADLRPERRPDRREEITLGLVRSRGRWRALGLAMALLMAGLAVMLAAWRFAPDRLPARLRPAEVMMSLGIEPARRPAPAVKPAPPESQFDE